MRHPLWVYVACFIGALSWLSIMVAIIYVLWRWVVTGRLL